MNFNKQTIREITGILFLVLLVFSISSLLSYNPKDPSILQKFRSDSSVDNLFGILGASFAGILVFYFGLGSFWIPFILAIVIIRVFKKNINFFVFVYIMLGGTLLIITTGSMLSIKYNQYLIFTNKFSAGGTIGIFVKNLVIKYSNQIGGIFILIVLWLIGLIMVTDLSIISIYNIFRSNITFITRYMILVVITVMKFTKIQKIFFVEEATLSRSESINYLSKNPKKNTLNQKEYNIPPTNFLDNPEKKYNLKLGKHLNKQSQLLNDKLEDFGVTGKVIKVNSGPVITTFEYKPASGVKINKIVNLTDDLALALRAINIRIVAPIPGKAAVGIEIPNTCREVVNFKEIITSKNFLNDNSKLTLCLGKDIVGNPVSAGLEKMPHLLIAGATGTGKSVSLNTMICSLLYKLTPDEVKLIMIDPKKIELSDYNGIPHLITPVVTSAKKATNALFWAVKEMENRYNLLANSNAKNIDQYNEKIKNKDTFSRKKLPYIVIIIDELADLMMVASRDVELALTRLAQMARAAGIHMILATQRPSVDVLTGIIKANFPTRLTFQVSSKTDSRTIIDSNGAETLLGNGDMLFMPPGTSILQRIHGAYIHEKEFSYIIKFVKQQQEPQYNENIIENQLENKTQLDKPKYNQHYDNVVDLVTKNKQA